MHIIKRNGSEAEFDTDKIIFAVAKANASVAAFCAFATNVDAVEEMTGLDFFSALPDDIETNLEAKADWRLVDP